MKSNASILKRGACLLTAVCLLLGGCSAAPGTPADTMTSQGLSSLEESVPASPSPTPSPAPTPAETEEPSPAPALTEREQKWVEDLDYFQEQYTTLHPNPFLYVTEEEFQFRMEQLKKRIPELSDTDMYYELQQIIAGFQDVHTAAPFVPFSVLDRFFPISVITCGERVYLCVYDEAYRELLEPYFLREIVAVNGVDMSYIRQKANSLCYPANTWFGKERYDYLFYAPSFFDWVGCDCKEGYTFHILNEDNEVDLVEVPAIPYTQETNLAWDAHPEGYSLPQSFLQADTNHAEYIEDERGGYVYLAFPYMKSNDASEYKAFFDTATELLHAHPGCKLVVDLRNNDGGHDAVHGIARSRINGWDTSGIEKTYILTDGTMASASIDLITVFKEELGGISVGEPTGQYHGTFGNRQYLRLPNSKIDIVLAAEWFPGLHPEEYDKNPNGLPYVWQNTILPDVYVPLDVEDLRQGKDSMVEWVLEH